MLVKELPLITLDEIVRKRVTYDYIRVILFEQSLALIGIYYEPISIGFLICDRNILTFYILYINDYKLVLYVRNYIADKTLRSFRGIVNSI
jgi:hypothetical protein